MFRERFLMLPLLSASGLAALAATAGGQGHAIIAAPTKARTLDLNSGIVTRGSNIPPGTVSEFSNIDLGGFIGADTGGANVTWFDSGTKGNVNTSNLMSSFTFAYCSSQLAVESGGVGGAVTLTFYEGYDNQWPDPNQQEEVAAFSLSGLPANNQYSSIESNFSCYLLTVNFSSPIQFSDGPIGYSWTFDDLDTGGILAATVPYLSCTPCAPDFGMTEGIDVYKRFQPLQPNDPPAHTIDFTGFFTSMSMDIREWGDCSATTIPYNSTSPACVDDLTGPPLIIGTTWVAEVTHDPGNATASTLLVRGSRIPGNGVNGGISGGEPRGRLLVTGAFIANMAGTADTIAPIQADQRNFVAPIPLELGLACNTWYAQALTIGAGHQKLSKALEIVTGTPSYP